MRFLMHKLLRRKTVNRIRYIQYTTPSYQKSEEQSSVETYITEDLCVAEKTTVSQILPISSDYNWMLQTYDPSSTPNGLPDNVQQLLRIFRTYLTIYGLTIGAILSLPIVYFMDPVAALPVLILVPSMSITAYKEKLKRIQMTPGIYFDRTTGHGK